VFFKGEAGMDWGGLYRDTLERMVDDLFNPQLLDLFCQTPNGLREAGDNQGSYLPAPKQRAPVALSAYEFVGKLIGIVLRTKQYLDIRLAPPVWDRIAQPAISAKAAMSASQENAAGAMSGRSIEASLVQLSSTDAATAGQLSSIIHCDTKDNITDEASFQRIYDGDLRFLINSADGREVELIPNGRSTPVTFNNRRRFAELALAYRAGECDVHIAAIRRGLHSVVPKRALGLFSGPELETLVCGSSKIDIDLWKRHTEYQGWNKDDPAVKRFWEVMEGFTDINRRKFIRFSWGRSRLPKADEWRDGVDPFKLTKKPGGDGQVRS
jgi:E3 ubiquitin-protein ligase HERC2